MWCQPCAKTVIWLERMQLNKINILQITKSKKGMEVEQATSQWSGEVTSDVVLWVVTATHIEDQQGAWMDRVYLTWCTVFMEMWIPASHVQDNGNKTLTPVLAFFSYRFRWLWKSKMATRLTLEEQQRTTTSMELYQTATFLQCSKSSLLSRYRITVHKTCTSVHLYQSTGFRL